MNLFLYQNEQQTGPFTDEQIQAMLQSGQINSNTLSWREGIDGWKPLSTLLPPTLAGSAVPPPPPKAAGSVLGMISLGVAIASIIGWIILLAMAGIAHNNGTATQSFNTIVGVLFMGGFGINFVAMVLGTVAAFKTRANTVPIIGACLNGFLLVALIALIIIGLMMKQSGQ